MGTPRDPLGTPRGSSGSLRIGVPKVPLGYPKGPQGVPKGLLGDPKGSLGETSLGTGQGLLWGLFPSMLAFLTEAETMSARIGATLTTTALESLGWLPPDTPKTAGLCTPDLPVGPRAPRTLGIGYRHGPPGDLGGGEDFLLILD